MPAYRIRIRYQGEMDYLVSADSPIEAEDTAVQLFRSAFPRAIPGPLVHLSVLQEALVQPPFLTAQGQENEEAKEPTPAWNCQQKQN